MLLPKEGEFYLFHVGQVAGWKGVSCAGGLVHCEAAEVAVRRIRGDAGGVGDDEDELWFALDRRRAIRCAGAEEDGGGGLEGGRGEVNACKPDVWVAGEGLRARGILEEASREAVECDGADGKCRSRAFSVRVGDGFLYHVAGFICVVRRRAEVVCAVPCSSIHVSGGEEWGELGARRERGEVEGSSVERVERKHEGSSTELLRGEVLRVVEQARERGRSVRIEPGGTGACPCIRPMRCDTDGREQAVDIREHAVVSRRGEVRSGVLVAVIQPCECACFNEHHPAAVWVMQIAVWPLLAGG